MPEPEAPDGPPAEPPPLLRRSDFVLLRRAARAKWGVPDDLMNEAIYQAHAILTAPMTGERERLAAMKFLLSADSADVAAELGAARLDLARQRLAAKAPAGATHGDGVRPEVAEAALRVLNGEPPPSGDEP